MEKGFFSTPELAELLGVFHTTVRRWVERDQIKGFRVGRNYKIPAAEVIRMLDQHGLPVPETLKRCVSRPISGNQKLFEEVSSSGSILQKLLIVDEIREPAFICRGDTILGTNQAFAQMMGYTQTDLIGTTISDTVGEFACVAIRTSAQRCFQNSQKVPVECQIYLNDQDSAENKTSITVSPLGDLQGIFLVVVQGGEKVSGLTRSPLFPMG